MAESAAQPGDDISRSDFKETSDSRGECLTTTGLSSGGIDVQEPELDLQDTIDNVLHWTRQCEDREHPNEYGHETIDLVNAKDGPPTYLGDTSLSEEVSNQPNPDPCAAVVIVAARHYIQAAADAVRKVADGGSRLEFEEECQRLCGLYGHWQLNVPELAIVVEEAVCRLEKDLERMMSAEDTEASPLCAEGEPDVNTTSTSGK